MSIKKLQAIFDAKPDAELSLPARADRDRDCLECMTQRRCFKHGPTAPGAPASLKEAVEGLRAGAEDAFDDLDPVDAYTLRCLAMVEDCVRGVISAGAGVPPAGVRS